MRVIGAGLFLAGCAATGLAVRTSLETAGVKGALAGLAAPIAVLTAIAGALLVFVPDFF